jgi:FkbM family methyltransferase
MGLSKYRYYAASVITLLTRFEDPAKILAAFLRRPGALPTEVRLRGSGLRFRVRTPMDIWIIKETCVDRDYLREIGTPGRDWQVVDVGAGLGDFTVLAARLCPDGAVHAYEPLPGSFELLGQNLALNAVPNVHAHSSAVASTDGTLAIESTEVEPVKARAAEGGGQVSVPAVGLDRVLDALPGGVCQLMKVDCEGGEYDIVLNSEPATLARVERIAMEYHTNVAGADIEGLARHLERAGFRVRRVANPVHDYLGLLFAEQAA